MPLPFKPVVSGLTLAVLSLAAPIVHAQTYTFTDIDDPVTAVGATYATGINAAGQVVGYYGTSAGSHGYVYTNGTFSNFDDPSASTASTHANGINSAGQVVGYYSNGTGSHGFLVTPGAGGNYAGGAFTTLDDPAATPGHTFALGINTAGQIVGGYNDANGAHGFVYANGVFTNFDDPAQSGTGQTYAEGINDAGQVVGYYVNGFGYHGFLYANGVFTALDNPFSGSNSHYTYAYGINNTGQIAGYYDTSGSHGFTYKNGAFTSLDAPGVVSQGGYTAAYGINNAGQVVGYYSTGTGSHGFIATLSAPEPSQTAALGLGILCLGGLLLRTRKRKTVAIGRHMLSSNDCLYRSDRITAGRGYGHNHGNGGTQQYWGTPAAGGERTCHGTQCRTGGRALSC